MPKKRKPCEASILGLSPAQTPPRLYSQDWTWAGNSPGSRFLHTGQTPGVTLEYRVIPERRGEFGPPSPTVVVYGNPPAPLPPEPN